MTLQRLILWFALSMSSLVASFFLPSFGECAVRMLVPVAAMFITAVASGLWLQAATHRQVKWLALGAASGAFVGLVIGTRWLHDAQGPLFAFVTAPVGTLMGTIAASLVEKLTATD